MAGLDIELDGLNALTARLAAGSVTAVARGSQVVRASAQRVVATAQQFVPVDTSATKNSIHAQNAGGGALNATSLDVTVGPTTSYAPYLEYGTVHMAPFAFMGPALDRETPAFVEAVRQLGGLL